MPGHAPNHLCFRLEEERVLFTGDTVLEGMYSVVNPARGGDMADVPRHARAHRAAAALKRICPGPRRRDRRAACRRRRTTSRTARSASARCSALLKAGPARIPDIVDALYADQDLHPKLVEAAGWQVHAHLLKLKAEGKVTGTSVKSAWKLA